MIQTQYRVTDADDVEFTTTCPLTAQKASEDGCRVTASVMRFTP